MKRITANTAMGKNGNGAVFQIRISSPKDRICHWSFLVQGQMTLLCFIEKVSIVSNESSSIGPRSYCTTVQ
jgi:hypothetical protein